MISPLPNLVTPSLVAWARAESGYSVDRVAKRLGVKPERVTAWESGERQPTFRQMEQLARFLHRPLGVFFLQRPPQITPLAAEYRRLPGVSPGHESPELRLALRQMVTRRENALNLLGELGEPVPELALRATLHESPIDVGQRLREASGVSVETQLTWSNEWQAWSGWRWAFERLGLLVFQFPKVAIAEARGLALLRTPLPVVAINSKELPETKAYTLFHETVHLMLAAGHEEAPAIEERRSAAEWNDVERFAEIAASHALVPDTSLRRQAALAGIAAGTVGTSDIRKLARRFRLTPLAMATRLRESGFMTWSAYRTWRTEWVAYTKELKPRTSGFATPVETAVSRAGRPFAQLVLEALSANRLTAVDASRYLDLKFEHFEKLRAHLQDRPGGGAADVS